MKFVKIILSIASLPIFIGTMLAGHSEEGFVSLFDGKTLKGWDGNPKFWSVQDGAITGMTTKENPTKGNTFIIWREGQLGDFELHLKIKIIGGNTGIQYRSKDQGDWIVSGYQADFEAGETFSGILYDEKGRGILARRGEKTRITLDSDSKHHVQLVGSLGDSEAIQSIIKQGQWNDYTIIARGYNFTHLINGRVTAQVSDLDKAHRDASGILAFQLHAGPPMKVQFKDIRIKPLGTIDVSGNWIFKIDAGPFKLDPKFYLQRNGNQIHGFSDLFGKRMDKSIGRSSWKGSIIGKYLHLTIQSPQNESEFAGMLSGFGTIKGLMNLSKGKVEIDDNWIDIGSEVPFTGMKE